jgi:hypothetical protein
MVITFGNAASSVLERYCQAIGEPTPDQAPTEVPTGQALAFHRADGGHLVQFEIAGGQTERRPHLRRYAESELDEAKSFSFRGEDGRLRLRAQTPAMFIQLARGWTMTPGCITSTGATTRPGSRPPPMTSRWPNRPPRSSGREQSCPPEESRRRIIAAIQDRYVEDRDRRCPTPGSTELLVIRHGQSEWNALGRGHGWGDPPLSPLGEQQPSQPCPPLPVSDCTARWSPRTCGGPGGPPSWSSSHSQSAGHHHGGAARTQHRRLGRPHLGRDRGQLARAKAAWVAGEIDQPPGGESRDQFHARLWQTLPDLVRDRQGQRLLVVAHGGVVRALERIGDANPRPIAFLSGRWFSWTHGRLQAGNEFMAEEPTGRDFEPTGQGN